MASRNISFDSIKINEIFGLGSFSKVCKAKCGQLLCAAKLLHDTFFQEDNDPGTNELVRRRFEQECQFLSDIKHPNIVQYLGIIRDPKSNRPVLLMELMDENLTRLLERSTLGLPYHSQLNICHDVALALAYLHSNTIIHRNLSSNNVLLIGEGIRAKLTDFGMSKQTEMNPHVTPLTQCPGTAAYMPPEALIHQPHYSSKLDIFSHGVLTIQIITRNFPNPGGYCKYVDDPEYPTRRYLMVIPEADRRKKDIDLIEADHPLLPTALHCIEDVDNERPSADELCEGLASLKSSERYRDSVKQTLLAQKCKLEEVISEIQTRYRRKEQEFYDLERETIAKDKEIEKEILGRDKVIKILQENNEEIKKIAEIKDEVVQRKEEEIQRKNLQITELQHLESERNAGNFLLESSQDARGTNPWNIPRAEVRRISKKQIGLGAWGVVYGGKFRGEEVAIKQAHREIVHVSTIDILKREIFIMAHIQHPNLVRFIGAVLDEAVESGKDTPIIISELLDMNLRDAYLRKDLEKNLISIFCDVTYALHYLHQYRQPIIHRDVSAPNVLLQSLPNNLYRAKVSDFGSANLATQGRTAGVGAIIYSAPEMFPPTDITTPPPPQTTKVDVFSYGILLLEVILKEVPTTEKRSAMLQRIKKQWKTMYDLIIHCTKHSPSDRPTMADILNKLHRL